MKSTIISMLVVLMVMVALPMIFLGDNNFAEQLGFGSFRSFGISGAKEDKPVKLPENVKTVVTDKKVEVYTWIDEHGVKQFSGTPPSKGGASEKIVLLPDTNIMDPVNPPEEEEAVASRPKVYSVGNPYTPGGMKDLVDNSKDLQDTMAQRQVEQEKMMQDLFPQMNGDKRK